MTKLEDEAEEAIYDYFIENGQEPKDIDEEGRDRIIQELFNTEPKFCYHSLKDFLDNRFSDYCEYLEDYNEYIDDYGAEKTADPVDLMNMLWYIYGSKVDFGDIQERMDRELEEEEEPETVLLPVQQ
jgi:hypothetical protein